MLGGGCALNSSFNGRVLNLTEFEDLFVPSAPADDGNAVGAAFLAFAQDNAGKLPKNKHQTPYLGSEVNNADIQVMIKNLGRTSCEEISDENTLALKAAELIAEGKVVGLFRGRAEFGPRALGNRSIIADPRKAAMKDRLNEVIKFRESFRPFAPSILHEHGDAYFEDYRFSPYMERTGVFKASKRSLVPAVCHADNTGRYQSVRKTDNAFYYHLIEKFNQMTGIPMVINTSLNVMGKPIVHSLGDGIATFFQSGIDALIVNNYIIQK